VSAAEDEPVTYVASADEEGPAELGPVDEMISEVGTGTVFVLEGIIQLPEGGLYPPDNDGAAELDSDEVTGNEMRVASVFVFDGTVGLLA
jgi:hypothetical protein